MPEAFPAISIPFTVLAYLANLFWSGIMVDMDAVAQSLWTKNNDAQLAKTLVQQVGMMASAWEHRMPELLFTNEEHPGEAVSAVKALAVAAKEGQKIYTVTAENVNAVLPVLNVRADVKDDIRDAVAASKVVTVSQNQVTVGGWTGVGYIITDPEVGSGAYMISGGSNGGELPEDDMSPEVAAFFGGFFFILFLVMVADGLVFLGLLYATMMLLSSILSVLKTAAYTGDVSASLNTAMFFFGGMLLAFSLPLFVFPAAAMSSYVPFLVGAFEAILAFIQFNM